MPKVLVARAMDPAAIALLEARSDIAFDVIAELSAADLDARIPELHALVLSLTPVGASTIAKAGKLKVVSRFGVGYDNVDVDALTRHGIPLTTVGDANAVTVAEHTMALTLAVTRQMVAHDAAARDGNFGIRGIERRSELWRKEILIIGFGRVGRRVARLCAAFGMNVIVADPYVASETIEAEGYRHVDNFHDALADADFVTLHMPTSADGRAVLSKPEFDQMKPGAYFINVARGALVDEDALAEALTHGHLRGAGLDVFREEPPAPDCPLIKLRNVILSPHIASLTEECIRRMSMECVQNALDGIDGRLRPDYVVNKEVLAHGTGQGN